MEIVMAVELIISVSGMRGIIGENLSPAIAAEYGCAFGSFLKSNKSGGGKVSVCLGRDSRPSGQMLAAAITGGLCSVGVDVVDVGIVPTPSVGVMAMHLGCDGGVVLTASHNPIEFNGIKLLLGNGIAPPVELAEEIRQRYFDKNFQLVGSVDCGHLTYNDDTDDVHIAKVLGLVDKDAIIAKGFKVALDSVNGAGGKTGKKLLEELGCEVVAINNEMTGIFAHTPEPTKENLVGLCGDVIASNADVGFAQDPDADRLAIVDGGGDYIGEEYTLAICAKNVFGKMKGAAAANLSTSRMIDDVAAAARCSVIRTAVGEANVAGAMVANNCVIGGEGNGGIIDLRVSPVRDSLVGMALVLELMAESGKSIAGLVEEIGGYYVDKAKISVDKSVAAEIIEKAKVEFADAKVNTMDGCRFDFDDGWVHLRTSNTEPVMRIIVETETAEQAAKYIAIVDGIRSAI
jgi:phosphomannomutase